MKLFLLFLALASIASARASTVTFSLLVNPGSNTFELFATSSAGDNDGIASYGVPLLNVLTLDHKSPVGTTTQASFTIGFSLFRTADDVPAIAGSQDTVAASPHIVYGFGQTAGNLAADSVPVPPDFTPGEQQIYGAPLLLADGTYGAIQPSFDVGNVNLLANTFDDKNGPNPLAVSGAMIATQVVIVPEPATAGFLLLGGFWLFQRRSRATGFAGSAA